MTTQTPPPKTAEELGNRLIADGKSPATVVKYTSDVRKFLCFLSGRKLTQEEVLAYRTRLILSCKPRSVNSMIAPLNSFFAFLGRHDLHIKPLKLQKAVFCPEERELTREEYLRLCRAAERTVNTRLAMMIAALGGTGMRVSELKFITAEALHQGEATVTAKGKTRTVFIPHELRKKLLRYAEKRGITTGSIFVTSGGKPVDRSNIWREMKSLCNEAGVSPGKVFPHNLRHLFARAFYAVSRDIAKLADVLGHSSVDTTRIYIISTGAEHRRLVEKMHLDVPLNFDRENKNTT